jgi:hypothetical protein
MSERIIFEGKIWNINGTSVITVPKPIIGVSGVEVGKKYQVVLVVS